MIKRILFVAVLVFAGLYVIGTIAQYTRVSEPITYVEEGVFSIYFPHTPDFENIRTGVGPGIIYYAQDGTRSYMVSRTVWEGGFREGEEEGAVNEMDHALDLMNNELPPDEHLRHVSTTQLTFSDSKARLDIYENDTRMIKATTFTDGADTRYILYYADHKDIFNDAEWNYFITSFKLLY